MTRVHLVISGRVQGVFFRQSSMSFAELNAVDGWVRNRPDGTVEVVAQGSSDDVERFVEWCRKGPEMAKVTSIERTDAEPVSMPVGFYVRPTA